MAQNKLNTKDLKTSKTTVAIIGLGNIGKAIATNLVKGNHSVILASREESKAEELANELGNLATAKSTTDAIKEADVVIPAFYFNTMKDFFKTYAKELDGKIIVDVSNPIAPDGNGSFKKIIGENESSAKILSELIPKNAKLVKAFGTLGAEALSGEAFAQTERKVLFYASDSTNINNKVEELITDSGFEPLHIGGLGNAIRIEVFGDLHQFGALGKTVTISEAKSKI
ncbi:MAG: NAD(P)-binding domain-containing protein [Sphingobacteriales bacterium]|nr:MAG: NAD(P)-binding domain-containing protein [Sphingobacteriales bacterium]